MAEDTQDVSPQDEELGTEELSEEEQLWEQDDEEESNESEDTEEEVEEEPEEEEDEPEHNFEKRYKDLEREFHKRNEDSAKMRNEFQDIRLQNLELQKQMESFQTQPQAEVKEENPGPSSDRFFDEDDKQTMSEFSELTKTFTKIAQAEAAKIAQNLNVGDKLETLEKSVKDREYQDFLSQHENHMVTEVGEDYRDIDKDSDFQSFVLASPAMTKMMTESVDPRDHASVMNLFLQTEQGSSWRVSEEEIEQQTQPQRKQARRRAASSLVSNSAPRVTKNPENMTAEELWNSIPDG
tara:strand:- start:1417 stop:2301 length:885 start_codon:yes stop_codon:yes gene_type:complete